MADNHLSQQHLQQPGASSYAPRSPSPLASYAPRSPNLGPLTSTPPPALSYASHQQPPAQQPDFAFGNPNDSAPAYPHPHLVHRESFTYNLPDFASPGYTLPQQPSIPQDSSSYASDPSQSLPRPPKRKPGDDGDEDDNWHQLPPYQQHPDHAFGAPPPPAKLARQKSSSMASGAAAAAHSHQNLMTIPPPSQRLVAPGEKEGIVIKTKFPVARIKRLVQADEDIGKVAQVTPVVVGRALELFMTSLALKSADLARAKNSKRITGFHLKQTVQAESTFDFLSDIVAKIPDAPQSSRGAGASHAKRSGSADDEDAQGVPDDGDADFEPAAGRSRKRSRNGGAGGAAASAGKRGRGAAAAAKKEESDDGEFD